MHSEGCVALMRVTQGLHSLAQRADLLPLKLHGGGQPSANRGRLSSPVQCRLSTMPASALACPTFFEPSRPTPLKGVSGILAKTRKEWSRNASQSLPLHKSETAHTNAFAEVNRQGNIPKPLQTSTFYVSSVQRSTVSSRIKGYRGDSYFTLGGRVRREMSKIGRRFSLFH